MVGWLVGWSNGWNIKKKKDIYILHFFLAMSEWLCMYVIIVSFYMAKTNKRFLFGHVIIKEKKIEFLFENKQAK